MADQKPAAAPKPAPKGPKTYHIVNPKGAIHQATREHAKWRLSMPGWRLATEAEVAELAARSGLQVADAPICAPWSPDPAVQLGEVE